MPWTAEDAKRHNSHANTEHLQKLWSEVANNTLESTGSDAAAIRAANSVLKHLRSEKGGAGHQQTRRAKPAASKSVMGTGMTRHWSGK